MADDDLIRRSDAVAVLLKAQIASCTCETKTPEPDWHRDTCRYRILREAEAMIHHVSPAPLAAAPSLSRDDVLEDIVQQAAKDARDVFSGDGSAKDAVDYMEQLVYVAIRALAPVKGDTE